MKSFSFCVIIISIAAFTAGLSVTMAKPFISENPQRKSIPELGIIVGPKMVARLDAPIRFSPEK